MNQPQTPSRIEQRKQFLSALSETNESSQTVDHGERVDSSFTDATQCPRCKQRGLKTLETRQTGNGLRRRKQCHSCKARLTTQEIEQTLYEEMRAALATLTKIKQLMEPTVDEDAA